MCSVHNAPSYLVGAQEVADYKTGPSAFLYSRTLVESQM